MRPPICGDHARTKFDLILECCYYPHVVNKTFTVYDLRALALYELRLVDAQRLDAGRVTLPNGDALLFHEWAATEDAAYLQAEKLVSDKIHAARRELESLTSLLVAVRNRKLQVIK